MGQTYELQNMNHYALYYFSRAVLSRPKDARMWNAMGSCYEKISKPSEAQKCYQRAESSRDREGIAMHQMGKLYHTMGPEFEMKAVDAF